MVYIKLVGTAANFQALSSLPVWFFFKKENTHTHTKTDAPHCQLAPQTHRSLQTPQPFVLFQRSAAERRRSPCVRSLEDHGAPGRRVDLRRRIALEAAAATEARWDERRRTAMPNGETREGVRGGRGQRRLAVRGFRVACACRVFGGFSGLKLQEGGSFFNI